MSPRAQAVKFVGALVLIGAGLGLIWDLARG